MIMNEEYLYVLDFSDCTISCCHLHLAEKQPEDFNSTDELVKYWGFDPNTCLYMFSGAELEIKHFTLPLN